SRDSNCLGVITESAQAFVEPLTREGIQKAKLDFTNQERFEKLKKYHGEKSEWVLKSWTEIWLSEDFANWSLQREIKKINCPVLCIHGDHDEYGSLAFPEIITSLVTPFDGSPEKKIISNCGHIPHKEYERLVLDYIHGFLKKQKLS
ncbi:MAG: alpha/beta hydrolase, partial [Bdellovibrionaceae bacterium]|nr:alpha/beta hydrolase [Pseudobdellovibrionaceae bacterium]